MASTSWNGRKLWLKSQIGIMRINALVWAADIPLPGVDFWYIFETQELQQALDEAKDYADRINQSKNIKVKIISGVAGNQVDSYLIKSRFFNDKE